MDIVYVKINFNNKDQYIKYVQLIEDLLSPSGIQIFYNVNAINTYVTKNMSSQHMFDIAVINDVDFIITRDESLLKLQTSKIKISTPIWFGILYSKL
jgi:predicted nucleic acid-binding protein